MSDGQNMNSIGASVVDLMTLSHRRDHLELKKWYARHTF